MNQSPLRKHLLDLLKSAHAHADFETAIKDIPAHLRGEKPPGAAHSLWEILEHMRIAQWDILEFTRNPKHVSPEFPAGYWPGAPAPPNEKAWDKSVTAFRADAQALADLIASESTDLLAPLPHAACKTALEEALLAADHNAYHLGELVLLRRQLGLWT